MNDDMSMESMLSMDAKEMNNLQLVCFSTVPIIS
jgi:hypothetical protein